MDHERIWFRFPQAGESSLHHPSQIGSEALPGSFQVDNDGFFTGGKVGGACAAEHSIPSSGEVKNAFNYIHTLPLTSSGLDA
jgi:hypothetical protein